jgi:hypothetical protein
MCKCGKCVKCKTRIRVREWRRDNPEKNRAQREAYYELIGLTRLPKCRFCLKPIRGSECRLCTFLLKQDKELLKKIIYISA